MLKIIISAVFKLIALIGSLLLAPLMVLLTPLMSLLGFAEFIPYFIGFFQTGLTYASWFVIALHIPLAPFVTIISLCGVFLTFNISLRAVLLVKNIYLAVKGSK